MKKIVSKSIAVLLGMALMIFCFVGCGERPSGDDQNAGGSPTVSPAPTAPVPEEKPDWEDAGGPYSLYKADGTPVLEDGKTIPTLFLAIDELCTKNPGRGAYVLNQDGKAVFAIANSRTRYLYAGTAYKGTAANERTAEEFLAARDDGHVIYGDGNYFGHSSRFVSGADTATFEPPNGAYVYKFSKADRTYVKVTQTVELTKLKLRNSQTIIGHNAYIYISSVGQGGVDDMGFLVGWSNPGEFRLCVNGFAAPFTVATASNNPGLPADGVVIRSDKFEDEDGIPYYVPQSDAEMTYTITESDIVLDVKVLSTGKTYTVSTLKTIGGGNPGYLSGKMGDKWNKRQLLCGTSFVPDTTFHKRTTYDIANGGYLKNVVYKNVLIYNQAGRSFDFYGDSDSVGNSYAYVTDAAQYTIDAANKTETVSVLYDRYYAK